MTIQPMPCAQPSTSFAASGPRCPAQISSAGRSPSAMNERYLSAVEKRDHAEQQRAIRRSTGSASSGQRVDVGAATTRARRARRRARPRRPSASQAWPISITIPFGRRTRASTASRSGATDHSSSSSRVSASTGSSPTSTAPPAPSAQRPAHVATHGARRPASQRPSASRTTHSTDSDARRVAADEPQRPAHRLQLEPQPAVVRARRRPGARRGRRGEGEPRSSSAAIARVGGGRVRPRRGSNGSSRQCAATCSARPGAAGEDAGSANGHSVSDCRVRLDDDRARNHWGWGYEDERSRTSGARGGGRARRSTSASATPSRRRPCAAASSCRAARRSPPELRGSPATRGRVATRTARSYRDVVRALARRASTHAPDVVAHPATRRSVRACSSGRRARRRGHPVRRRDERGRRRRRRARAGATPARWRSTSRAARPRARGRRASRAPRASRPARPARGSRSSSREHGLTLRFFPQSFELSTLGGWIATRAAGHFATGPTHIDDLVESVRAVTLGGDIWESRRLPGSGAGPSPDRLLLGSEGTLGGDHRGVGARAARATSRAGARASRFDDFAAGARAVRAIVQAGLRPANCRLVEAREARADVRRRRLEALLCSASSGDLGGVEAARRALREHGG